MHILASVAFKINSARNSTVNTILRSFLHGRRESVIRHPQSVYTLVLAIDVKISNIQCS